MGERDGKGTERGYEPLYMSGLLGKALPSVALPERREEGGTTMILLSGKYKDIMTLLGSAIREGYGDIPAVWAIKLWAVRN